jgi:hypothetical protein
VKRSLVPPFLSVLAACVYLPNAFRSVAVLGDSPEVTTAAVVWGVPHAPGYPLCTLLGHLFAKVPFFDVALRVNAMNALAHAVTVGVVAWTIGLLTPSLAAMLGGALALMMSRSFLLGSLYAEVFAYNDLFFALLLLLALRARDKPSRGALVGLAALSGLASAHHQMIALSAPALVAIVGPAIWARKKDAALYVLAFAAPFAASYGLAWAAASRDPAISWGDVHDLGSLAALVGRRDYGGLFSASRRVVAGQMLERLDAYFGLVGRSFALGSAVALVGLLRKRVDIVLSLLFAGPVFAAMNAFDIRSEYRVAFFERFTTMSAVPIALLIALGIDRFAKSRAVPWALAAAAVLPLVPNVWRFDFSRDTTGIAYARDLVVGTPRRSLVLVSGDMAGHATLYACGVLGVCEDRTVMAPGQLFLPWKARQIARRFPELGLSGDAATRPTVVGLIEAQIGKRPVYVHPELVRKHPELASRFVLVPELLLLRVYDDERAREIDMPALRARYAALRCEGCAAHRASVWHPSMQGQLSEAYAAGLADQVRAARQMGWTELAREMAEAQR